MTQTADSPGSYVFETHTDFERRFPNDLRVYSVTSPKDLKTFYQMAFQVYRGNPCWVPPFWQEMKGFFKKQNLFWSHAEAALFIAKRNDTVIGRIAAIIDHAYCKAVGEDIGYFGFFECINDDACASALFQVAQDWLTSKKMTVMRGPIDGRIDIGCGFLLTGFENRATVLSTYSPPYYLTFAEKFGLKKARDFFHYTIDLTRPLPKVLEEKARHCRASGIQVRSFHRLHTGRELDWWCPLFLETFAEHWGFVPVSPEEVRTRFGVRNLRWFVDSRLFVIAEGNGAPVAYLWATPEYNQVFQRLHGRLGPVEALRFLWMKPGITSGKLHFIGIQKEFRHQNIGSLLNYEVLAEMKKRGYTSAEVGWFDEQNITAHATIALTGAIVFKKHRVFEKNLIP
ncbi:MAG: GNAT family N-acetyltransferase [Candidatus Thermoplasmatota archaeon]